MSLYSIQIKLFPFNGQIPSGEKRITLRAFKEAGFIAKLSKIRGFMLSDKVPSGASKRHSNLVANLFTLIALSEEEYS